MPNVGKSAVLLYCVYVVVVWVCVTWRSGLDIAAGETSATGAQIQLRELGSKIEKLLLCE